MKPDRPDVRVRGTRPSDFEAIIALTRRVYPGALPWTVEQLASHLRVFPEGQFVAEREGAEGIAGMAASLVVYWDDYDSKGAWRDFTAGGMFTNHDPEHGRTLYGAEVMVDPDLQRSGVGAALYAARRALVSRLGLLRIRAAGRLRGYHQWASQMSAEEYVLGVLDGRIHGPTLSFQMREGFQVIAVIPDYLPGDPESLGYAALIEWLNPEIATEEDAARRNPKFLRPPRLTGS